MKGYYEALAGINKNREIRVKVLLTVMNQQRQNNNVNNKDKKLE